MCICIGGEAPTQGDLWSLLQPIGFGIGFWKIEKVFLSVNTHTHTRTRTISLSLSPCLPLSLSPSRPLSFHLAHHPRSPLSSHPPTFQTSDVDFFYFFSSLPSSRQVMSNFPGKKNPLNVCVCVCVHAHTHTHTHTHTYTHWQVMSDFPGKGAQLTGINSEKCSLELYKRTHSIVREHILSN